MKKFARCVLILIMVVLVSGTAGYFYENSTQTTMYTSTTQLYVVPGEENEATVRAANGGLKDDFIIVFKSGVVIQEAQKIAGTSEDIAKYLTVNSPANSNIVEITCTNPDQNTAKQYVDAVAKTALKTTSIIPVKSIQILSEGTSDNVPVKPDLYRNTAIIAGICGAICAALEIIIVLILCAFRKPEDHSDDEFEYEKYYGKYAAIHMPPQFIDDKNKKIETKQNDGINSSGSGHKKHKEESEEESEHEEMKDILEDFDEDYAEEAFEEKFEENADDDELEVPDSEEQQAVNQAMQEAAITKEQSEKDFAGDFSEKFEENFEEDFEENLEEYEAVSKAVTEDELEEQVLAEMLEEEEPEMIPKEGQVIIEAAPQELQETTDIDIYRIGKRSSSRIIARIEK